MEYDVVVRAPKGLLSLGETARVRVEPTDGRADGAGAASMCNTPVLPNLTIERASCAPSCTARLSGNEIRVTATEPGTKRLKFAYLLETTDGDSTREGSADVWFGTPDRDQRLPQRRRLSVGDGPRDGRGDKRWTVRLEDASGAALLVDPSALRVDVGGSGAVEGLTTVDPVPDMNRYGTVEELDRLRETRRNEWNLALRATAPGTTDVTFECAGVVRRERVRVIDVADVRRAELRSVWFSGLPVEQASKLGGPVSSMVVRYGCPDDDVNRVVPWLETTDGTIAIGGAGYLGVEPSDRAWIRSESPNGHGLRPRHREGGAARGRVRSRLGRRAVCGGRRMPLTLARTPHVSWRWSTMRSAACFAISWRHSIVEVPTCGTTRQFGSARRGCRRAEARDP